MSDREFSHIQIFQHWGKGMPQLMTGHKNCLQSEYLLGPCRRLIKKEFTVPRSDKGWETLDCRGNVELKFLTFEALDIDGQQWSA
jgi:hypothetical protein